MEPESKLVLPWILCYSYRAFSDIQYINQENALSKVQWNTNH